MTHDEMTELMDLLLDDALPEALRARVDAHVASDPDAARDLETLRAALARLRSAPPERPDGWFVERALDRLLREHADSQAPVPVQARE